MVHAELVVVASVELAPGTEHDALAAFADTIRATHEEPGCLSYALHRDTETPTKWMIIERWVSAEALDAHMGQPYVAELFARIGDLAAGPPTIQRLSPVPVGDPEKGVL